MKELHVTLIDVGWGDSILIESIDNQGTSHYGLIDSNDTSNIKSTYIFLKTVFLKRKQMDLSKNKPVLSGVMLSHAHMDHGQGLKYIMKYFGTKNFYYPKSLKWKGLATLIGYANRSSNVGFHQAIDNTKLLGKLGDVDLDIIWPNV